FSSRRRHTRSDRDWSSDVCSSDLVMTASMPVFVVENRAAGNCAYATLNEGLGKVLRYGAHAPEVLERLGWFRDVLGPALGEALRRLGGIDLRALIGLAVAMVAVCPKCNRAA